MTITSASERPEVAWGPPILTLDPPGPPVIEVRDLHMQYGARPVVRGIDLTVRAGEIFAFLGPNGAGKTTTVEIMEGFRSRTGGDVRVLGADPATAPPSWRERVGVVLQTCQPEPDLTARETIDLYAGFYARPLDTDDVLAMTGLEAHAGTRNHRLSGGQQRRLDVALALIGDPDILFLDEPTTGFDPAARRTAWDVIAGLKALGKTVFLTTHYLEEAETLADRVAVIVGGLIVAEGEPATLGGRDLRPTSIAFHLAAPAGSATLPPTITSRVTAAADGRYELRTTTPVEDLRDLTEWALEGGRRLEGLEVRAPSLEETYLDLIEGASF